jgi:glycosyltransferase involved in cell wall biosynthesis
MSPRPGIIAFAKDWHEDPTSNHHVLIELARSRPVLWLNSVATRTPKLTSGRDLGKIKRKLGEFARGPVQVLPNLWVFSPLVLPLPHSRVAQQLNRMILRATIAGLRRRLGLTTFDLWTFLPNTADYVGAVGERASVYYCVDEWSLFSYLDRQQTVDAEARLLAKVDACFAINHALADAKRALNPNTFVSPHGVDHAMFSRALDPATELPSDVARLPRPIIGFYGTLQDWVDYELLAGLARRNPTWSIVLLGQALADTSAVAGLRNVHLLGRKPHAQLPAYCKAFDVGLIPYRIDARMNYVNPIKLREYLSAGVPVVSTPVPEVVRYRHLCSVADGLDDFERAVVAALADGGEPRRRIRSQSMASETWTARVAHVAGIVDDLVSTASDKRTS